MLWRIRQKSFLRRSELRTVDADKLEKACVSLPDPSPKVCTQLKALCSRLAKEFGGTGLPTLTIMQ